MAQQRVIIIGAGVAGLSLAQGLQHATPPIPFHIFERDSSASFRAQGYRVRISSEGAAALKRLLPESKWAAFEATCAEVIPGMIGLDATTGSAAPMARPGPTGPLNRAMRVMEENAYNVDRTILRKFLLQGLEAHVSFGKRFQSYSVTAGGDVEVQFLDGSVETGSLLIGADGVNSTVRRGFLPELAVMDTQGRAIFGKTYLKRAVESLIPKELTRGICVVSPDQASRIKLFCDTMRFQHRDEAAKLGIDLPEDYIYWVLIFHEEILGESGEGNNESVMRSLLSLTEEESAQKAVELASSWDEKARAVLEHQDTSVASTLAFTTCLKDNFSSSWETRRGRPEADPTTLLGDAAHPMPPVGGVGANSALQEAADLLDSLIGVYHASESKSGGIAEYETKMRERATATIERSALGAGRFFDMKPAAELKSFAW